MFVNYSKPMVNKLKTAFNGRLVLDTTSKVQ